VRLLISRIAAIGLNFLLLAAATYFAARSVDDVFVMWWTAPVSSPVRIAAAPQSIHQLVRASYEPIVERDVFNSVKEAPAPEEPVVEDLDLHLKLIGTSHLSMAEPFAIIEDTRNQLQSLYQLNTQVADAGKLVTIEKERVLIDHGGHMVALEIPKTASNGSASTEAPIDQAKMDKADAFRKEQEKIIQQHRMHPRRMHQDMDANNLREERQAQKEARRNARGSRRFRGFGGNGYGDGSGGGAPRPMPPGANKIFQPEAASGGGGGGDD